MAYPVHAAGVGTDGTNSATIELGDAWPASQLDGDMFIVVAVNDDGTTAFSGMTGWTSIYTGGAINGQRTGVWYQIRSGTDITAPTITGMNNEWAVGVVVYRDVDTTTPEDVAAGIVEEATNTQTPQCPSVTTTTANATILRIVTRDSTNMPRTLALMGQGSHILTRGDTTASQNNAVSFCIFQSVQVAAGATGTANFTDINADGGVHLTIALRNASGGKVPAYPTSTPIEEILPLHIAPTSVLLSDLHPSPETLLGRLCALGTSAGGTINNGVVSASAATNNYLLGYFAYVRNCGQNQTITTGLARTYGAVFTLTATTDLSNALFIGAWSNNSSSTQGTLENTGQALYFRDTAGAWVLWRPLNEAQLTVGRTVCVHMPSQSFVQTGGGTINWAQIERIGVAVPVTGTTGTAQQRVLQFYCLGRLPLTSGVTSPIAICGGSPTKPLDSRDVANAIRVPWLQDIVATQGAKQNLIGVSVQIGDGVNPTYYNGSSGSTEFHPESTLPSVIRLPEEDVQYRIKAASGDVIRFGSQSIGSLTRQRLVIDPASSTGATYDFTGTVFNMAVTLDSDIGVANATYTGCSEIAALGATLTSVSIDSSTGTTSAILFTGNGGIVDSSINVSGTSLAYHIRLDTTVTALNLTNTVLLGTPSVNNIHVLRTTGTVTITTAAGQTAPTFTTAGATVVINELIPSTVWTNEDLPDGTTILTRNTNTDTTIEYVASLATGTGYTITLVPGVDYTVGDIIEIRQSRKNGTTYYEERTSRIITTSGGGSIVEADPLAVSTICTAFGLDGAGATINNKFDLDYIAGDLDFDVTGNWQTAEAMVFWKTQMTVQSAMEEFWGAWSVQSDGSFLNNVTILPSLLDTTITGDCVETTGRRIYRSDGARPVRSPTTGGGAIDCQWRDPVTVVPTIAAVTPADIDDIVDAVWDEALSGHLTAGTTGAALDDATTGGGGGGGGGGSLTAADVWTYSTRTLTASSDPSAATIATALRSELTPELGRIDATVSSRLASASYAAPLDSTATQAAAAAALNAYDPPTKAELDAGIASIPAAPTALDIRNQIKPDLVVVNNGVKLASNIIPHVTDLPA